MVTQVLPNGSRCRCISTHTTIAKEHAARPATFPFTDPFTNLAPSTHPPIQLPTIHPPTVPAPAHTNTNTTADCVMPCSFCGNWCFFWGWTSVWKPLGEPDPAWWDWEIDQADANLFWLRGCWPTCSANETWAELHEAEQEAYRAVTRLVRALHEALAETRWTWSYRDYA